MCLFFFTSGMAGHGGKAILKQISNVHTSASCATF